MDYAAQPLAVASRDPRREPARGGVTGVAETSGDGGKFSDVAALEVSSLDVEPELQFLSGRICRPCRHQGHADGTRRARCVDDRRRYPRVCRHLYRDPDPHRRQLRPLGGRAVYGLARDLCACGAVLRAAPWPRGAAAGRCSFAHDGAYHRCLYQHRDRETVLAHQSRSELCALRDAGFHGDRVPAVAHDYRLRSRQPDPECAAHRIYCWCHTVAVDAGQDRCRCSCRCDGDGVAAQRYFALDHVGIRGIV